MGARQIICLFDTCISPNGCHQASRPKWSDFSNATRPRRCTTIPCAAMVGEFNKTYPSLGETMGRQGGCHGYVLRMGISWACNEQIMSSSWIDTLRSDTRVLEKSAHIWWNNHPSGTHKNKTHAQTHYVSLCMYGWMDGKMYACMDGWMDEMYEWMYG